MGISCSSCSDPYSFSDTPSPILHSPAAASLKNKNVGEKEENEKEKEKEEKEEEEEEEKQKQIEYEALQKELNELRKQIKRFKLVMRSHYPDI